jgi:hypothetical protein
MGGETRKPVRKPSRRLSIVDNASKKHQTMGLKDVEEERSQPGGSAMLFCLPCQVEALLTAAKSGRFIR